MNDFSDLENQLKAIRPAPLRETFIARVEQAMTEPASVEPDNVIRPQWFRSRWLAGVSLAAAAAVLVLLRVNFKPPQYGQRTASVSPQPSAMASQSTAHGVAPNGINAFIPAGATQVVYHQRDEGLQFEDSEQPLRRVRSITQETWQWRNPSTGASLRVTYPSEQIQLIPVSGQ